MKSNDSNISLAGRNADLAALENSIMAMESARGVITSLEKCATGIITEMKELESIRAQARLQMKVIDTQFETFLARLHSNETLYAQSLPTFNRLLDRIQDRIDRTLDKALALADGEVTESSVKNQEFVMGILTAMNNDFNAMVAKLVNRDMQA